MLVRPLSDNTFEVITESDQELEKFKNFFFPRKSLKAKEVMEILGINRVTLSHYVTKGLITAVKQGNGHNYYYDYESVMNFKNK